jgi:hypothetical protein
MRICRGVVKEGAPSRTGAPASSKTLATSSEQKNARSAFAGLALSATPAVPTAQNPRLKRVTRSPSTTARSYAGYPRRHHLESPRRHRALRFQPPTGFESGDSGCEPSLSCRIGPMGPAPHPADSDRTQPVATQGGRNEPKPDIGHHEASLGWRRRRAGARRGPWHWRLRPGDGRSWSRSLGIEGVASRPAGHDTAGRGSSSPQRRPTLAVQDPRH